MRASAKWFNNDILKTRIVSASLTKNEGQHLVSLPQFFHPKVCPKYNEYWPHPHLSTSQYDNLSTSSTHCIDIPKVNIYRRRRRRGDLGLGIWRFWRVDRDSGCEWFWRKWKERDEGLLDRSWGSGVLGEWIRKEKEGSSSVLLCGHNWLESWIQIRSVSQQFHITV